MQVLFIGMKVLDHCSCHSPAKGQVQLVMKCVSQSVKPAGDSVQ